MPRLYRILSRSYNTDEVVVAHQVEDIRQQLNEQLRCFDQKLDTQTNIVLEIQDFFRKRAEVEAEYARGLDRLTKQFGMRHKADKQKRESWPTCSTFTCWQYMMNITRRESRDHAVLAELYSTVMFQRLGDVVDDLRRTYLNCREISFVCHEDMLKVLNELQTAMKQYHVYHSECKQAEQKLKHAEEQKMKVEQQTAKGSKKLKGLEKQVEKRQAMYEENKQKAQTARNDYLLAIDAANASLQKYFVDDLQLLIDSIDFGYHNSVQRAMLTCLSAVENLKNSQQVAADCINKCVQDLDQSKDKHKFVDLNGSTFQLPKRFEFQPHKGDEVCQVTTRKQELKEPPSSDDLVQRYQQIDNRLESMRLENEELWKSVEEADKNLIHMINQKDYDVTECFQSDSFTPRSVPADARKKRLDTEAYYFEKLREVLLDNNLVARLMAKYVTLKRTLTDSGHLTLGTPEDIQRNGSAATGASKHLQLPRPAKARRVAKTPLIGQPKVFGCNLEEYIEATDEQIPLVMRSCIRAINLHGMHHEGIFRVSGLQVEINEFKAAFEKGEDPLASVCDGSSINSIAGVLKSFFRELKEPLFPLHLFDSLVEASRHESVDEAAEHIRDVLHSALSRQRIVVMRYLFAFLNHLSQYSDENLMYPYNLSICFGPTLLPIPPDKDQVAYQAHVNELVKTIIVHQEKVFPIADAEPIYEKILIDGGDRDDGDGSEDEQSEEDADVFEAMAAYDFEGRSDRELTFKKGTALVLYKRVSADWWEGACQGKEGLIADKYIIVKRPDDGTAATITGRLMSASVSSEIAATADRSGTAATVAAAVTTPEKRRSVDLSAAMRRLQQQQQHAATGPGMSRDSRLFIAAAAADDSDSQIPPPLPARLSASLLPLALGKSPVGTASVVPSPAATPSGQRSLTTSVPRDGASTPSAGEILHSAPLSPMSPMAPPPPMSPFDGPPSDGGRTHFSVSGGPSDKVGGVAGAKCNESQATSANAQQLDDDLDSVLASVMSDLQALSAEKPVQQQHTQTASVALTTMAAAPAGALSTPPSKRYSTTFSADPGDDVKSSLHEPAPSYTTAHGAGGSGARGSAAGAGGGTASAAASRRQTPDLVQDLPVGGGGGANSDAEDSPAAAAVVSLASSPAATDACSMAAAAAAAPTSVADAFANSKTNTILRVKSSSMPRSQQPPSSGLWDTTSVAATTASSTDDIGAAKSSSSAAGTGGGSFMTDEPGRQLISFRRATSMSGGTCTGSRAAQQQQRASALSVATETPPPQPSTPAPPLQQLPPAANSKAAAHLPARAPSAEAMSPVEPMVHESPLPLTRRASVVTVAVAASDASTASTQVATVVADSSPTVERKLQQPGVSVAAETSRTAVSSGRARTSKLWNPGEVIGHPEQLQQQQLTGLASSAPDQPAHAADLHPAAGAGIPVASSAAQSSSGITAAAAAELAKRKVPPPVPSKAGRPPPPAVLPKPHTPKPPAAVGSGIGSSGSSFTDL